MLSDVTISDAFIPFMPRMVLFTLLKVVFFIIMLSVIMLGVVLPAKVVER
jgi:hypothetical protein